MTSRAAAKRYARAMFDVAIKEGLDLEQIASEIDDVNRFIAATEALQRVFANPAIPASRKRSVVEQLLARSPVSPLVSRTLLLLADRDRLGLLPDLVQAYRERLMDHRHVVRAHITTAVDLPADRQAALEQGLAAATGRQVHLDVHVDPAIVGGAIARIGSTVYDGSITTQLQKLKKQLVEAD